MYIYFDHEIIQRLFKPITFFQLVFSERTKINAIHAIRLIRKKYF